MRRNIVNFQNSWLGFGDFQKKEYFTFEDHYTQMLEITDERREHIDVPLFGMNYYEDMKYTITTKNSITIWGALADIGGLFEIFTITAALAVFGYKKFLFETQMMSKLYRVTGDKKMKKHNSAKVGHSPTL